MGEDKVRGNARFQNGRLVLPNNAKVKRDKAQTRLFKSKKSSVSKKKSEDQDESLDLNSWRNENQKEWMQRREMVVKTKKERDLKQD